MADFHHLLGIDLEAVLWQRSFRWFDLRIRAILAYPDSMLGHMVDAAKDQPAAEPVPPPTEMELTA